MQTSTLALFSCSLFWVLTCSMTFADEIDVWIGTAGGTSRGIYHIRLDVDSGKLSRVQLAAEISAPGFLALHPEKDYLYSAGRAAALCRISAGLSAFRR